MALYISACCVLATTLELYVLVLRHGNYFFDVRGCMIILKKVSWPLLLQEDDLEQMPPTDSVPLNASCVPYTGDFCREELLSQRKNCFLESQTSDLLIFNNPRPSQIHSLVAFGSPGCRATGVPFLCLLTLGVCGRNGTQVLPSKETCIEISNGACRVEFEQAGTLGFSTPDCSILPEEEFSICLAMNGSGK